LLPPSEDENDERGNGVRMKPTKLSPAQFEVLAETLSKREPSSCARLMALDPRTWVRGDRSVVRDAVAAELMSSGFQPDWEPTERGVLLEGIIDFLTRLEVNDEAP